MENKDKKKLQKLLLIYFVIGAAISYLSYLIYNRSDGLNSDGNNLFRAILTGVICVLPMAYSSIRRSIK
jgi:hypothetical protein